MDNFKHVHPLVSGEALGSAGTVGVHDEWDVRRVLVSGCLVEGNYRKEYPSPSDHDVKSQYCGSSFKSSTLLRMVQAFVDSTLQAVLTRMDAFVKAQKSIPSTSIQPKQGTSTRFRGRESFTHTPAVADANVFRRAFGSYSSSDTVEAWVRKEAISSGHGVGCGSVERCKEMQSYDELNRAYEEWRHNTTVQYHRRSRTIKLC